MSVWLGGILILIYIVLLPIVCALWYRFVRLRMRKFDKWLEGGMKKHEKQG